MAKKPVKKAAGRSVKKQGTGAAARPAAAEPAAPPLRCGSVSATASPITAPQIKLLVLRCVASLPGAGQINPNMPDSTKVDGGLIIAPSGDPIVDLADECMNFDRFETDGLFIEAPYVWKNGTTLGGFVQSILCCYKRRRAAGMTNIRAAF